MSVAIFWPREYVGWVSYSLVEEERKKRTLGIKVLCLYLLRDALCDLLLLGCVVENGGTVFL
jgi:hypothetical protein